MIQTIHFSGGGYAVLGYIGVVHFIDTNTTENEVKKNYDISGTSAGGIIAFLICLGYTSFELVEIIVRESNSLLIDTNSIHDYELIGDILQFDKLWNLIKGLCSKKQIDFFTITFSELYELKRRYLTITGTCLSTGKCEEFNVKTCPDMLIHKALEISTCLPFLFKPIEYNGNYYVDGAVSDCTMKYEFMVGNKIQYECIFLQKDKTDIFNYMYNLYNALASTFFGLKYHNKKCIIIESCGFLSHLTKNDLLKTLLNGYEQADLFFKKQK